MFCSKCGNKLPDDSVFCPECGERLVKPDFVAPPSCQSNGSKEEKVKIEYVIDTERLNLIFIWVFRLFTILSNLTLIFLAFDFDKMRKEHIGLMLFPKNERLEEYFKLFFTEFELGQWTILFAVCFIIVLIIFIILVQYITKKGFRLEGIEQQPKDKEINLLIEATGILCTLAVWLWILI